MVPVFDGFNLTHLDVKVDKEGARRLATLIFSEGEREYAKRMNGKTLKRKKGWKARLGGRAAGWAMRLGGGLSLPYETTIPIGDADQGTMDDGRLMRDAVLAYALPYLENSGISQDDAADYMTEYLTQVFAAEGDCHLKTRAIKSNTFDKDTQQYMAMELSTDDAEELAHFFVGST